MEPDWCHLRWISHWHWSLTLHARAGDLSWPSLCCPPTSWPPHKLYQLPPFLTKQEQKKCPVTQYSYQSYFQVKAKFCETNISRGFALETKFSSQSWPKRWVHPIICTHLTFSLMMHQASSTLLCTLEPSFSLGLWNIHQIIRKFFNIFNLYTSTETDSLWIYTASITFHSMEYYLFWIEKW